MIIIAEKSMAHHQSYGYSGKDEAFIVNYVIKQSEAGATFIMFALRRSGSEFDTLRWMLDVLAGCHRHTDNDDSPQ
jgi:hypothetical protein